MMSMAALMLTFTAAAASRGGESEAVALATPSHLQPLLLWVVRLGILLVLGGMLLCLYRLLRGPHLADRVVATDALSIQVVGLVILFSILFKTGMFFDAALAVAIVGFISTVGFSQYIGANPRDTRAETGKP